MPVLIFGGEQDTIERANTPAFGLDAGVMTTDLPRVHRVADAQIYGNVWVSNFNILPLGLPFGGAKHSGFGRDAFSEVKSVHITL